MPLSCRLLAHLTKLIQVAVQTADQMRLIHMAHHHMFIVIEDLYVSLHFLLATAINLLLSGVRERKNTYEIINDYVES